MFFYALTSAGPEGGIEQQCGMCNQQSLRSACAYKLSDLSDLSF